jgi:phage shock protein E
MPTQITREDVQKKMIAEGAILIDTLPEGEYAEEHIAGAVNVPLKKLGRQTRAHLAKDDALIVYCYDTE